MSSYVIETYSLTKVFGAKTALGDLDLRVAKGGVHALIGSNGAGKSTLFRLLLGFLTPSAGSSYLLGHDSLALAPETRGLVGYVNEEHTLPGWLSAAQLKRMQQCFYAQWREDVYQSVIANFDVAPGQKVASLSRGERAGLNLAMALAQNPLLLILDEPTLGLDVVAKQEFLDALMFCASMDTTIIYCSHQMDEVERMADELIILENGRLRAQSAPEEFLRRVSMWIVEARHMALVRERVNGWLSGRLIENDYHFYMLDAEPGFARQLALMGIGDAVSSPIGLSAAVRAFLSRHHRGMQA